MTRWIERTASTLFLAATLPLGVLAQAPAPVPAVPNGALPPVVHGVPALPPGAIMSPQPFRSATPYNPTYIGRQTPNPAYDKPNFTLPADNPNVNFAPLQLTPPDCLHRLFAIFRTTHMNSSGCCGQTCGGCDAILPNGGCGGCSGSVGTPVAAKPADEASDVQTVGYFPFLEYMKGNCDGPTGPTVLGVGSHATWGNTKNFVLGSSRSFFGESSREFFERPPSVDGVRFRVNPPPVIYRDAPYNSPPCPLANPTK